MAESANIIAANNLDKSVGVRLSCSQVESALHACRQHMESTWTLVSLLADAEPDDIRRTQMQNATRFLNSAIVQCRTIEKLL